MPPSQNRNYDQEAADLLAELEGKKPTAAAPETGFKETPASVSGRENAEFWKKAALPAAGVAAGAVLGPMAGAALGATRMAPWIIGGEMTGGALGELGNQALGITEPSALNVGINAVAPGVGRFAGAIPQFILRELPGSNRAVRAGIADNVGDLPDKWIDPPDSRALYDALPKAGEPGSFRVVDLPSTSEAIHHFRNEVHNPVKALESVEYGSKIQPLLDSLEGYINGLPAKTVTVPPGHKGTAFSIPTGLPSAKLQSAPPRAPGFDFEELVKIKEGVGQLIKDTPDGKLRGAYRQLYKSILTDMEALPAPAGTSVDLWKQAQASYKQEIAKNDLADVIEKNIKSVEGTFQFQADPVRNWIKNDKQFRARVGDKVFSQIDKELAELGSYTGRRDNKLFSILLGSVMGGVSGALGGYVAADAIASALLNPTARKTLTKLVTANHGKAGRDAGAILAASMAGQLGVTPKPDKPMETEQ